jgi:arylsulfatase A-like enzyme
VSTAEAQRRTLDRRTLPIPDPPFQGVAGRTLATSKPDFPEPVTAPPGAPNVLLVLIDDAGFGNPSTFGGPVQTPTFEALAGEGLRYNRFHVTALCSPSRAALLSGRNHHAMGFGQVAEFAGGWPGYNATWPQSAASIAEILRNNGYNTAAFGKWHLTPDDQQGPAGPFNRWPSGLGFDYFWGFLGGETSQYDPLLTENNTVIGVPEGKDYYFPDDMAAKTVSWIRGQKSQAPERPFFIYFATGSSHAPHHIKAQWADKYKGKFDAGWDALREQTFERQKKLGIIPADAKLTPRNEAFPAWDSLPATEKRLYARQMEVYAGYQENADYQVGRVVQAITEIGLRDDTLIIYIFGDNGSSMEGTPTGSFNEMTMQNGIVLTAEQQLELIERYGGLGAWGGPNTDPHFAAAWAWAGNTPFQWGKQVASHFGGTRDPMVVSWPKRIKDRGGLRSQFTHLIDIAPTILELTEIPAPTQVNGIEQMPIHGTSFAYTLDDRNAAERHTQPYFEIMGYRAMYKDGWMASCFLDRIPWDASPASLAKFAPGVYDPDKDRWELYKIDEDFSQANDVAANYPEKLKELRELFWQEAAKYQVLPLLGGFAPFYGIGPPRAEATKFTYFGGVENVGPGMIPHVYGTSYAIDADLHVPESGVEGVIVAEADFLGGFALYVEGGKLQHTYSFMGVKIDTLSSPIVLPGGDVHVRFEFLADQPKPGTGGKTRLLVDGMPVVEGRLEHTVPMRFSGYAGMDIGRDNGRAVSMSYASRSPFPFTGMIDKVVFDLEPTPRAPTDRTEREHAKRRTKVAVGISG